MKASKELTIMLGIFGAGCLLSGFLNFITVLAIVFALVLGTLAYFVANS